METDSPITGQISGKPISDLTLCYFVCKKESSGAFVGAIMITDHRARPEYFAHVQPVSISPIQKILYGSSLEAHLRIDVIGQKLWKGIPKQPDILFVEAMDLREMWRIALIPTAFLSKPDKSESESLSAVIYNCAPEQEQKQKQVVAEIVASLDSTVNLIEPFERIQEGLRLLLKTPEKA